MNSIANIGNRCTGCGACSSVCQLGCIKMVADSEGFLYPHIDEQVCVSCGACEKACPVLIDRKGKDDSEKSIAYAAKTRNGEILLNSSSGGIFTELASRIIESNGVVFGAAFDSNFGVEHIMVEHVQDLEKLRGSKYVQSRIGDTYVKAKEALDMGRTVLYTGTPCQIGGLYAFLKHDYDHLYTQDIICHGVPSPMLWDEYVKYRENKAAAKLRRTFFRHKKYGWKRFSVQFEFTNCTEYLQIIYNDLYMRSFLRNMCLRNSCYHCAFKTKDRQSDITLADFWGIENVCPSMDDDKGTSLVIVNSDKGKKLFGSIAANITCCAVDFDEAIKYNTAMVCSASRPPQRDEYMQKVAAGNFEKATKRYCSDSLKVTVKKKIYRLVQKLKLK